MLKQVNAQKTVTVKLCLITWLINQSINQIHSRVTLRIPPIPGIPAVPEKTEEYR